ncbi:hypothetical protein GCM10012275_35860 [Longimycelium tulufanense]|uniref:Mycothiol-dependent maleylpyruvate isomerase metal-binding domain-containing protein n=1 Tax=Longimycelium tulufanense TaxID=907463 RepID=A0A8J3CE94_9PSEU|nr:maleylpyruvate isomerase N-terminal domain-containing protein [Longimycelium tulufanense]GGM61748.1 hypothetical protein GCM10012275_35860 [Longimycelium tulufanense]
MTGKALLDYGRLLDVVAVEGERLASAARGGDRELPVPGCPGLTLGTTVSHTTDVYRAVLRWLRGEHDRTGERAPRPPAGTEFPEDVLREVLRDLLAELWSHDPGGRCRTWWPEDQTYGFWWRRLAHETTVHRVDVQAARGAKVTEVDGGVALDGVDEALTLWFGYRLGALGIAGVQSGEVGLVLGEHAWLTGAGTSGVTARRASIAEAETADAVITGDPTAVYLWLWGRLPDRAVLAEGDHDAVAQLWALLRLAMR